MQPAGVPGAGERASADDRLQAVDRGQRVAGHRRLRQDRGVHALGDHAVKRGTGRQPPARSTQASPGRCTAAGRVSSTRYARGNRRWRIGRPVGRPLPVAGGRPRRARVRAPAVAGRDRRGHPGRAERRPSVAAARARRGVGARSRCPSRSPGSSGAGRTGAILFSQTFGAEGEARFGAPYLAVHRADLLSVLAAAVPAGRRRAGPRGRGRRRRSLRRFADGSASEPFDVLIGADGIHSVVRDGDARSRVARVHRAGRVPRAGAGRGGAGVRPPPGLLDLARPAAPLRPLPGLGRRADQPRHRQPGGRLARGVLDGRRARVRGLPGRVRGLGRAGACS